MNIPRLALTAAAAIAAFSFFGASPAAAAEAPVTQSAASNALPGLPTTGTPVRIVDEVVTGICGVIKLGPCERANGDPWKDS